MKIATTNIEVAGTVEKSSKCIEPITISRGKMIANVSAIYHDDQWVILQIGTKFMYYFTAPETAFTIREVKG